MGPAGIDFKRAVSWSQRDGPRLIPARPSKFAQSGPPLTDQRGPPSRLFLCFQKISLSLKIWICLQPRQARRHARIVKLIA